MQCYRCKHSPTVDFCVFRAANLLSANIECMTYDCTKRYGIIHIKYMSAAFAAMRTNESIIAMGCHVNQILPLIL